MGCALMRLCGVSVHEILAGTRILQVPLMNNNHKARQARQARQANKGIWATAFKGDQLNNSRET